eukprot:TRINITY_DN1413_c0_g1_i2.p1 TRINITY_DN1413_c0_g1~~TRINITY_DN1413_c0_g1_i2.p1  ORF type:complete len:197 (-),score=25.83 TRINITY_DN1413_c0_g1_i2:84-674(-)
MLRETFEEKEARRIRARYKCSKCGKSKKGHTCEVGSSLVFHSTVHDVQHSKTKQQLEKSMRELEGEVHKLQQENAYLRLRLREIGFGDNLSLGSFGVPYSGMTYPSFGAFTGYGYEQTQTDPLMASYAVPATTTDQLLAYQAQTEHLLSYPESQTYAPSQENQDLLTAYPSQLHGIDPTSYSLPQSELLSSYNIQQ